MLYCGPGTVGFIQRSVKQNITFFKIKPVFWLHGILCSSNRHVFSYLENLVRLY